MEDRLLKANIEKTLDILDYAFKVDGQPKGDGIGIFLTRLDLERGDMDMENLIPTLHYLKETEDFASMEFSNIDFTNGDESLHENPDPYPSLVDLVLPNNFPNIAKGIRSNLYLGGSKVRRYSSVFSGDVLDKLEPEVQIGDLISYNDGTIRFKDKNIDIRPRLKDLCRIFMRNPDKLITLDTIREELIDQKKREGTPNATLAKYVSDLHLTLQKHYKKEVIFNQRKEGWMFNP